MRTAKTLIRLGAHAILLVLSISRILLKSYMSCSMRHGIFRAFGNSKAPDQTAKLQHMIMAFAVHNTFNSIQ